MHLFRGRYITASSGLLFFFLLMYGQASAQNTDPKSKRNPRTENSGATPALPFQKSPDTIKVNRANVAVSSDRTEAFLDSLRKKSERNIITRKLYDILVIEPQGEPGKEITESSENDFRVHSGKKIRNIEIKQIDVFGSSIANPMRSEPDRFEKVLNKTHANTREAIIRKNLLFKENDTVSALLLSDNERIIRQLPYINDARIIVVPVSDTEADIIVFTKDIYSVGIDGSVSGFEKWNLTGFERNIFGTGHEFSIGVRHDADQDDNPGIDFTYRINNIKRSFINTDLFFSDGMGNKTFGLNAERKFVSSETKYAGGISLRRVFTTEDLDTLTVPEPLRYNLQDYWIGRSFMIDRTDVTRLFVGFRYTNNNVYDRPFILPDSYYHLQKYNLYLGSISISTQKYYRTNLIYSYGRTEDIPHGGMAGVTLGIEDSEFKSRRYAGLNLSAGTSVPKIGYFYTSAGLAAFFHDGVTEQGLFYLRTTYLSNLLYLGKSRLRNFVKADYTRGFDRYLDEYLLYGKTDGFAGFRNDSARGDQRLTFSIESVIFTPGDLYGFKFAVFGFSDIGFLFDTNEFAYQGLLLSSIGLGIRIRNDNLLFNTFQVRLGFFPNLPQGSSTNSLLVSGEKLLRPQNFEPGKPSILPYR